MTALALTKIGASDLTVCDFDTVDEVNIGCQLYGMSDVSKNKTEALKEILLRLTDIEIKTAGRWTPNNITPIMISGVDSMEARREIWEGLKVSGDVDHYIDGRMGGEYIHILTVDMANKTSRDWYEQTLNPKAVEETSCSARGIAYNTLIIGGLITQQVKKILKNEERAKEIIFDLPSYQLMIRK
jgi:hypothetical protein